MPATSRLRLLPPPGPQRPQPRADRLATPVLEPDPALRAVAHLRPEDKSLAESYIKMLRHDWGDREPSPRTVVTYAHGVAALARFLEAAGGASLLGATRDDLLVWRRGLAARSPKTAGVYLLAARRFYGWLVRDGDLTVDPTARIALPAAPLGLNHPLSAEDIRAIEATQNPRTFLGARNLALFAVLLDTGLRVAECAALRTDQVDGAHATITVLGKGRKLRVVRLGVAADRRLDRYLRARRRHLGEQDGEHPALWRTTAGKPLTVAGIQQLHDTVSRQTGIALHPHRWRHTFAQTALDAGMSREDVRLLLGHSSEATLRVYTSATDAGRALEAHRQYSPADRLLRGR